VIIDCHCHAGKGDGLTGPWDTAAPLGLYLRRAANAGIQKTVLFAAFHSDYASANRQVGQIVVNRPDRFYGFAFLHPINDRGRIMALVREAVDRFGFVGIKVHRHDARITREICEVAQKFRLPVLYDVMGEVSICELLAQEYPDVNFIIPHLGSFSDDWRAQHAFIDYLVRHPNIYTDTSGVRRFDLLVEAVRRAGAHKVLFGSDGPWLHPGIELIKVKALRLPRTSEQLILGGTFLKLVGNIRSQFAPLTPQLQTLKPVDQSSSFHFERKGVDPWIRTGADVD
jgi:predicted TIM-barrel fold metal-dependent hydrolase